MLLEDVELDLFTDDREVSLLQSTDGIQFGSLPDRDGLPENLGVMVSSWLQQCKGTHIRCGSHNSHVDDGPHRELPTRLVDVTRFRNAGRVSLASGSALKTTVEYVALSHRWPPGRPTDYEWTTKTTNEDTRRDGFAANILPRAVQDAINMTSQIGIHYLWVDSLCIVQDSRQDWELESSKMLSVFGNAAVTFFADCAENDNDSFLKPRALGQFQSRRGVSLDILGPNNRPLKTCLVERYSRYKSDPPAKATNLFLEDVIQSHLSTRGWIFQEQVISPRRLHFGRHQMYWACGESYKAEDGTKLDMVLPDWYRWLSNPRQNGATDMTNILGEESAELWLQHRNWAMLVEDYTMRSLTVSADKFRALAALAKVFGRTFQDVYMVGCWKRCFRLNLLWSARRADGSSSHPTQRNGQIPSWSWLSADGAVEYPHLRVRSPTKTEQTGLIHVYFIVVDLPEIIPDVSDPFGSIPIFCGPIKVKGLLEPAICSQSGEQLFHSEAPHWSRRMQQRPEETPYLLLYSKSNPEKAIGSMIPDRRNGILLGEVMLFKTTETQGQCLCCGFDKTNHIHFLVLERELDAVERFHRVGFGWTYVREDQMMMLRSTEIHDGRGLWLGEPQLLEIV
ncbi:heterokaryon incompatibility protein-domain-containing protein [Cladorrhinum sp. PSN332]|nr:heterokaryon incompatibility protein-domain-containing protein [Cladorrhinum sp. PSN332]